VLYVADTGKNRVIAFALEPGGARPVATVGELGSGPGRFAGPLAIAVGRSDGANTRDVYVADAHSRRIVRLHHDGGALRWVGERRHDADVVTSLDTDHWGAVYVAAPNRGVVRKLTADLAPVAELRAEQARPRGFDIPFVNFRDHRDGRTLRLGQPHAVLIQDWSSTSGAQRWNLGLEIRDLAVTGEEAPTARFTLTDRAAVTLEIQDGVTRRNLGRRVIGALGAGDHAVELREEDLLRAGAAGELVLRLSAASSYTDGPVASASTPFRISGDGIALPAQPMLLGNTPNPVLTHTRIAFLLPDAESARHANLRVFDATGRVVRRFEPTFTAGFNEVLWDGRNDRGHDVAAGVYFYRLDVRDEVMQRRMVRVR
jgi:hypothetical protein